MKKSVRMAMGIIMVLVMGLSFVGCGSKTKEGVVAEGTGATNWGYDMNLLYQENADGTVKIYMTATMDEQPSIKVVFDGTVEKGEDEDGDACVTLKLESATMYGDLDGTGEMSEQDGSDWLDQKEQVTNTYDAEKGTYSLPFEFSLYGYATCTADIEVAPVETATDADEWGAQYL